MSIDIKLHKKDLPDDFKVSNTIAVDCEMGGLNVKRDPLFLVQISSGNQDAHIIPCRMVWSFHCVIYDESKL